MGSVLPKNMLDRVQWCENHLATFTTNATAIGTSSAAVTALGTLTSTARAAFDAQQVAQDAAKDATGDFHIAVDAMTNGAADIVRQIKAKAAIAGDSIYTLASIPIPAPPSPVGPPGTPTDFKASLNPDGSLNLAWKCVNPAGSQGTTYQVYRKLSGEGAFTFIGATGTRTFLDDTVPSTGAPINYQIVALRSTATGTAAVFVVNFGVDGGSGVMSASVLQAPKLAA